ncbi:MAG: GNAT family N-acetyltransferase [Acidimicrobiales bacterium]|nr:GNAT family N-acetyltransferase [Acidimicrobiales bacterium]
MSVPLPAPVTLRTPRLVLRPWRPRDREAFAALNADPVVMEHFPAPLARAASDAFVDRIEAALGRRGWGLWALEVPGVVGFAGYVGLEPVRFEAHFTPAVEVGWRLDRAWWGRGYAPEGATAALGFAFDELGLDEVVSFTAVANARSRQVMAKLGMVHDPADDFDHPDLAEGDRLRRHVLYRIRRAEP